MTRPPRYEHLFTAATVVPVTVRPAFFRGDHLYKIDARDPSMITILLRSDITAAERRDIADEVDENLRILIRRRRRAGLEPVVEIEADEHLDAATGTEGDDVEFEALARRATLRVVDGAD